MMKSSLAGIDLIKNFEGLRLKAYGDVAGNLTIGYGHTKGVKKDDLITQEQAEAFLAEDLKIAEDAVNLLVTVALNQTQFDSLVSFVFNVGETQFGKSTLLRKLNESDYQGAAAEFTRWAHGGEDKVVIAGLVRRRLKEQEIFSMGIKRMKDIMLTLKGEDFMISRHAIKVQNDVTELPIPFKGRILIFRDSGAVTRIGGDPIFDLDEIT